MTAQELIDLLTAIPSKERRSILSEVEKHFNSIHLQEDRAEYNRRVRARNEAAAMKITETKRDEKTRTIEFTHNESGRQFKLVAKSPLIYWEPEGGDRTCLWKCVDGFNLFIVNAKDVTFRGGNKIEIDYDAARNAITKVVEWCEADLHSQKTVGD